jgi:hypothetical protein
MEKTTAKIPPRVLIPGIMQTLREIRDKKSLEHMNMTAQEALDDYERRRKEYSFWPQGTVFANGVVE